MIETVACTIPIDFTNNNKNNFCTTTKMSVQSLLQKNNNLPPPSSIYSGKRKRPSITSDVSASNVNDILFRSVTPPPPPHRNIELKRQRRVDVVATLKKSCVKTNNKKKSVRFVENVIVTDNKRRDSLKNIVKSAMYLLSSDDDTDDCGSTFDDVSVNDNTITHDTSVATWIRDDEYKAIREENWNTIQELKNVQGKFMELDANKHCLRGLETQAAYFVYNTMPSHSRNPKRVVQYQKLQRQLLGENQKSIDPESLSQYAQALSHKDQQRAIKMAFIDSCLIK